MTRDNSDAYKIKFDPNLYGYSLSVLINTSTDPRILKLREFLCPMERYTAET